MARIALLIVGHRDYQNDIGERMAAACAGRLRESGVEVDPMPGAAVDPLVAGAAAREALKREPDGVILFLGTWIECPTALGAIREFEHLPFAIWAFPMFQHEGRRESTGSFVAWAVLKGALDRMAYRYEWIIGLPEDDAAVAKAAAFARAAHAFERLKRTRIGLVGYAAMGMYPGTFDHVLLRRIIGPEVEHIDTFSLVNLAERFTREERGPVIAELRGQCEIADDVTDAQLQTVAGMALALRQLVTDRHLDAMNVKCQYELSQEYGMVACVPMSLLAEWGVVSACEGDAVITATMCILHYLTGQVVYYGDILDLRGDQMLISSCGLAPFSLAADPSARRICQLGHPGFEGVISSFVLQPGTVTFARLAEGRGDYRLNFGLGTGVETELRQGRFPGLEVRIEGSVQKLLDTMASQHFALCYGDVRAELHDLCRILGIEAVEI
jgi:L-fucose isomerase-like protein